MYRECDEGGTARTKVKETAQVETPSSRLEHVACGCALMIFDRCTATFGVPVRAPCAGNFRTRVKGEFQLSFLPHPRRVPQALLSPNLSFLDMSTLC